MAKSSTSFKKGNKDVFTTEYNHERAAQGSKLRANIRSKLAALLEAEDYDPFRELITIGREAKEEGDYAVAANCAKEIAGFLLPKLKSIEVKAEVKQKIINHSIQMLNVVEAEVLEDTTAQLVLDTAIKVEVKEEDDN